MYSLTAFVNSKDRAENIANTIFSSYKRVSKYNKILKDNNQ